MGGPLAVPRKRRRDPITIKCDKLFDEAMEQKEYEKAANIVYYNVLNNYAAKGIMTALYDANSFIRRSKKRRGLI